VQPLLLPHGDERRTEMTDRNRDDETILGHLVAAPCVA
jgi:hypothetical protein